MGLEIECVAVKGNRRSAGKAHLDNKQLLFRGDFRMEIPLSDVVQVVARKGLLEIEYGSESVCLELGKDAEKMGSQDSLSQFTHRQTRCQAGRAGLSAGNRRWRLLGASARRTGQISRGQAVNDSDWIFLAIEEEGDLGRLKELERSLRRTGSIWVVWRKGRKELNQNHVMSAAKLAQLVDVKVVSFSDTHSGLKLMIPKSRR